MRNLSVDLTGQNAIVTGGGAGIGRAIALALGQSGAAVAINDLNPDRAETVAAEIEAAGGRATSFQGDVGNRFQVAALIERARDQLGRIHIFVNAAGIYKNEPMAGIDEWDWRRQIEVNISGTFFCTQLIGRVMADEGGGCIVNIASTAGHPGTLPQGIGYVTGKAGVIGMTKQAARELAPHGIRVNAVCPGNIPDADQALIEPLSNVLGRPGEPEDVAGAVLFLCSQAADFITGQALNVDGGEAML